MNIVLLELGTDCESPMIGTLTEQKGTDLKSRMGIALSEHFDADVKFDMGEALERLEGGEPYHDFQVEVIVGEDEIYLASARMYHTWIY